MVTSLVQESTPPMKLFKHFFVCAFITLLGLVNFTAALGAHFHSVEIYYECISTGPDAGKFKFYAKLYRDCSINSSVISPQLDVTNVPNLTSIPLTLASGYPQDATPTQCGLTCADQIQDISLEIFLFESPPVVVEGVPPPSGYQFAWQACCRVDANNIVDPINLLSRYEITMYPYNGQSTDDCYDSSPAFAEPPSSINCSGYQLRYNPNAIDSDLDSLSYRLIDALPEVPPDGSPPVPVQYQPGFSGQQPFPGPNPTVFDPATGQLSYDSDPGTSGRYTAVMEVLSWRCGQLIAKSTRDMTFAFAPCADPNNIPVVAPPVWNSPGTASGFDVTVQAGDLVNFTLEGVDADIIGGQPQTLEFTAEGAQFSSNYTDPNSGCLNTPCATLTNSTPPTTAVGSVSTTFNWQTDCNHVGVYDNCGNLTNTYNFLFKYKDDYCPASGYNIVNVAVTVVGEEVIESPQPHCASTDAAGNIILSWQPVVDNSNPPSFEEYVIQHSTSATGPFTDVGTVTNINTDTWTHNLANPSPPTTSGPNYYQIRTRSGCGGQVLSAAVQTISSIYLTLTENGSEVTLNWTPVATPPFASSNPSGYQVYREYPAGTWSLLDPPTTGLTFTEPIVWCNEQVNYRVELTDNLTCTSVSNIVGEVLSNDDDPAPQEIDSVTVQNELARISWSPNAQTSVNEYTVEQNNGGIWTPLTTLAGYTNTDWVNPASNAAIETEIYRVKATNECLVSGQPGLFHRTILAEVTGDGCTSQTNITWTPYINWPEGVKEYEIHCSQNGNPEVRVGTVADTVFEFTHSELQAEADYCYRVIAVRNTTDRITSTSNDTCVYLYVPKRPEYGYNYNSTVQAGNTGIEEYFFSDSLAGYLGYEIQRGTDPNSMSYLWFLDYDPNTRFYDYVDAGAQPQNTSYYYSVIGVDSCENYADTLNMTRTVHLETTANKDRTNTLQWNAFEGWNGGVTAYNIYRSYNGPFTFLKTVGPNQLTALDSIEEILEGEGNFCYYVEAVEGVGAPVGTVNPVEFMELSRSNEACARQHPNLFIPNAFMPEGVNNVFKPVTIYVQSDSYLFQVYNRWGQMVFESNDPDLGWDGSSGGKDNPQGAYVYFISFVSSDGQTFTKRGTVTLIR